MQLSTLSDFKAYGYSLTGHCGRQYCGKSRALKLDALIDWLGPEHVVINDDTIANAFRCECGHKGGTITINPPRKPVNTYAKAKGG